MTVTDSARNIAFVGNCLPRACGIATFTFDLAEATATAIPHGVVRIVAINDDPHGYRYPACVTRTIQQEKADDYAVAADYLDAAGFDAVSLQHEFGIFGGEWGSHVLTLLRRLRRPVVVTCHTVPVAPEPTQREILREIGAIAKKLVVMNKTAVGLLEDLYSVPRAKIAYIRHGVHDVPFTDPPATRDMLGVRGRVLLTFGLLHRNKGIEHAIDAMPSILRTHPDITYVILGATHPNVLRKEGEAYRTDLQRRATRLGVHDNVVFLNRFVHLTQLLSYLAETDIFIAPYVTLDHITSGALAYAVGAGKAVVATPFLHALELLAEGRGRFVPPGDVDSLAAEVSSLLSDEKAMRAMRRKAYVHTRPMVWSRTAEMYLRLFSEVAPFQPARVGRSLEVNKAGRDYPTPPPHRTRSYPR
jgi:glycosyltransferase involved in cell wall biosynthesis